MAEQEWLNPSEAAEYLGVSRQTLYHLMNDGKVPYSEVRGVQKRRLRKKDLDGLFVTPTRKKKTAR